MKAVVLSMSIRAPFPRMASIVASSGRSSLAAAARDRCRRFGLGLGEDKEGTRLGKVGQSGEYGDVALVCLPIVGR